MRRRDLVAAAAALALPRAARAEGEVGEVRFVRQLGIGYLQIYIVEAQNLLDKHAKALGLPGVKASFRAIGSPAVMNDLLLGGAADIVVGGFPPFLVLWDKTVGTLDVKNIAALNSQPLLINTNNPALKAITDVSAKDKIALPAVKVSTQAVFLQMIAAAQYGMDDYQHFDAWTVGLSHPDAAAALISGHSEITVDFASMPLQYEELRHPGIRRIGSSYDATHGPATTTNLWTTRRFHDANPLTMKALVAALAEATDFLRQHPLESARIYVELEKSPLDAPFVATLVQDKEMVWGLGPQNTMTMADFLFRIGRIKHRPASWKDMFFPEVHDLAGS